MPAAARITPARATAVVQWGLPRLRDLPWRRVRDPWWVLVSEVMLQQTQASRVLPKWSAFIDRFPTPLKCAEAPLGDVLRLWHGLGYPRRARNLHLAAQCIAERGAFPNTLESLQELPGVGAYTARAVLAFAFEIDAAVVDTNIARVYARYFGTRMTQREVQAVADASLPPGEPWAWNQCLMDLGAQLCRAGAPACSECPLRRWCVWRGNGDDPSVGSAGVSKTQGRFEGSDRQLRGRLMKALGDGAVPVQRVAIVMGCDGARAERLVRALCDDGLCVLRDGRLQLP